MKPLVSAVITTFNRSASLKMAIESVLQQTFADFELLILDNNSQDDTERAVRSFSDERIRYIKHPPLAISGARNLALKESSTDYIAFLDDDDVWLPNKLFDQYAAMKEDATNKVGLVYGAYTQFNEAGHAYETIYPAKEGDVYEHAVSYRDTLTGSASNPLLKKSAVLAVGGYDETIKTGEDYEMFLRLAKVYYFKAINAPVVNIYHYPGYRLGWRLADYLYTEMTVYQKHQDFIKNHPAVEARYLQILGGKCFRLGRTKEGRKFLKKAFRITPFYWRLWGQWVLSFLPVRVYQFAHRRAVMAYYWRKRRENHANKKINKTASGLSK